MTDNSHFPSDVVQAIQESVMPSEIIIDDISYVSREIYIPPAEPTINTLDVVSLGGIVEYRKQYPYDAMFIHVIGPTQVALYGSADGRHKQRDRYVHADCKSIIGNGFRFGEFMDIEQFIINLQSQFVATEATASLLAVVGNLASENVRTIEDDGVSQAVEVKTRLAQRNVTLVPNPVNLRPYRTFPEVPQPASDFVFRLKQGKEGQFPQAALFAADGGRWKIEAIANIKSWLEAELVDTTAEDTSIDTSIIA